jgi:hypothetical protein
MIDLTKEKALPLSDAAKHPLLRQGRRLGRPIHRATLERWRTNGVGGVVLETCRIGGLRVTTVEALERFFHALSNPGKPSGITPRQARREHDEAEEQLAAAGM